ncbi:hypothetical protein BVF91_09670 [Thermoanaerobacterium sp. PSU-2]|uniref:hypothetical protein n=1 Tax=Thermoanaerobacterium sp. PSU-2 TaxID=1930849 RepID=UPI000A14E851|nr:hypothetical protein [Thermoanaerobacterium sp. PSU-2]ORX22737.1 hypothetical protein BVF91_09670 [Thermoanaerobacterium sp. PSU-2]
MLTWHEKLTLLMILEEKLHRLQEKKRYYVVKLNEQKITEIQKDIYDDIQEQIKELESLYQKVSAMETID